MNYKQNVEYDNVINNQVKRQMDYIEEKEYRRKEEKKIDINKPLINK